MLGSAGAEYDTIPGAAEATGTGAAGPEHATVAASRAASFIQGMFAVLERGAKHGRVGSMYVGIAKIALALGDSHSLKDKRMVLRRIKDRVRERLGVAINEVGDADTWQRAELGCAVVSGERAKANAVLDQVIRVTADGGGEIIAIARRVDTFEAESVAYAAKPAEDDGWIPDAWREELE